MAVDIGGTFTDLVYFDEDAGVRLVKVPTVPSDPVEGVLAAVGKTSVGLEDVDRFFHGTTLGINTLLEGKGAPTGLVTTAGFRDVLEIGRMNWPMYRLHWEKPDPLIPRRLRLEVRERILADGRVAVELEHDDVRHAAEALRRQGIESVAVSLINAYAYPAHEEAIGAILEEEYPDLAVTLSHRLAREFREYERTCTTAVDAIIRPRLTRYLHALEGSLREAGLRSDLRVTRSDGGVMDVAAARRAGVRTLLSGPASGVMGAAALAGELELASVLAADMGGTSFDAAVIIDGAPGIASSTKIQGFPLLMPVVELATIGAGGGSIARIDASGTLEVGPQSAAAVPGPICYGQGGTDPTFTDAAVVTGLIDPAFFLGGDMQIDREAAREGIASTIAAPLALGIEDAAAGIVDLAEAKMAATLEGLTIGKGLDPREFALIAYGGGGPLVANALAARLGIRTIVIPTLPAAFSAWGMLTLDEVRDFAVTRIASLQDIRPEALDETFDALDAEAQHGFDESQVPVERRRLMRSLDMRYENQEHTLSVRLEARRVDLDSLRAAFDAAHRSEYGYVLEDPVEVVTYRLRSIALLERPAQPPLGDGGTADPDSALKGNRSAWHRDSGGVRDWSVYDRQRLLPGHIVQGPAIIEEPSATIPVLPGYEVTVHRIGHLLITKVTA